MGLPLPLRRSRRPRPRRPPRHGPPLSGRLLALVVAAAAVAGTDPARAAPGPAPDAPDQAIERRPRCPEPLEVLVEEPFAREQGLRPGDSLGVRPSPEAEPCPARVAGLYRPRPDPARLARDRPRVLFHLPDLARVAGREREVDRFSVELRPGVDPDATAADLEALLPGTRVVTSTRLAEESSTTFRVVERFHRAIGLVTLVAGAIFLACIMILKVQERRTEVAALRLAGVSRRTLLGWIMAEASLVAGGGGVLGIGIGRLASGAINRVYRGVYDTSLAFSTVTAGTVRGVLVLAVVLGLGAGLAAALHLLSLDPLEEVGR